MNAHHPATKADLEQIGDNLNVLSVDLHALRSDLDGMRAEHDARLNRIGNRIDAMRADLELLGRDTRCLKAELLTELPATVASALRDVFAAKGDRKVVAGLQVDVEQLRKQF